MSQRLFLNKKGHCMQLISQTLTKDNVNRNLKKCFFQEKIQCRFPHAAWNEPRSQHAGKMFEYLQIKKIKQMSKWKEPMLQYTGKYQQFRKTKQIKMKTQSNHLLYCYSWPTTGSTPSPISLKLEFIFGLCPSVLQLTFRSSKVGVFTPNI